MKTKRLYYEDCHLQTFDAQVLSCENTAKGYEIILSETAFYPEGGGQPCDLGTLSGIAVLDVQEREETVVHLCQAPLPVGESVSGQIDWNRRFDLMQQHSGEHIVSGIVHKRYGYHNVGFHMGTELITIDFDGMIPAEALPEIEAEANRILWQNLPIHCLVPEPEALARTPYRTKRALPWPVRLVQIPDTDSCACCGVHVAATGEIGLVKLFTCVKFHQGVRIEMACGGRALALLNQAYDQNRQVSQVFSAKIGETGAAARQVQQQLSAEKFRATGLLRQLFAFIAADYAGKNQVVHFAQDLMPAQLRELAEEIRKHCPLVLVFSGAEETGYSVCIAGSPENVQQLGTALRTELGGRGGGKPGFFQGSIPASKTQILAVLENRLV